MDVGYLLRGIIIGFSIAAPVGPIGVLCIRRALTEGWRMGLFTGLGAATADAFYGAIAALGLTALADLLVSWRLWLTAIGGIFLLYLGIRTFLAKPPPEGAEEKSRGAASAFLTTFLLTVTNPVTILSFVAIFTSLGATAAGGYGDALLLVGGVFVGSAFWWLLLSGGVSLVRNRVSPSLLVWVNRASGAVIAGFGLIALLTLFS